MTAAAASNLSEELRAIATIILALSALVGVVLLGWVLIHQRRSTIRIESKLGNLDIAVNGVDKAAGEKPLIDKVRRIESTLDRICGHLGLPTHSEQEKAA